MAVVTPTGSVGTTWMYKCPECESVINTATEVCPQCGVDLTALAAPEEGTGNPKKKKRTMLVVIWLGVLIGATWGFLWFVLPDSSRDPQEEAETQAIATLREVAELLREQAQARAGEYPASLEALGNRVRKAAQDAQTHGYRLSYVPGATAAGRSRTFALVARPDRYGYRSFYIDQTGVIRETEENREATSEDPPIK